MTNLSEAEQAVFAKTLQRSVTIVDCGWLKAQLAEVRKSLDKWDKDRLKAARNEVDAGFMK